MSKAPRYSATIMQELNRHGWPIDRDLMRSENHKGHLTPFAFALLKKLPVALEMARLGKGFEESTYTEKGKTVEPWVLVVKEGRTDVLAAMMESDPDAWKRDEEFWGCLLFSAITIPNLVLRRSMMTLLFDAGADMNVRDADGTPFFFHLRAKADIELFMARGGDVDDRDDDSNSALHRALEHQDLVHAQTLIDCGCPVDQVFRDGFRMVTLLTHVIEKEYEEGARFLMKNKASPNAYHYPNPHGIRQTSPIMAALVHLPDLIEPLVFAGADCTAVNEAGKSVFKIAKKEGRGDELKYLVDNKAALKEKKRLNEVLQKATPALPKVRL
jgi:ankyrin repeat protein